MVLGLVVPIEIVVLGVGVSRVAKSVHVLGVARLGAVCTVVVVVVVLCDVLERRVVPGLRDVNANVLVRNSNFFSLGIGAKKNSNFVVFLVRLKSEIQNPETASFAGQKCYLSSTCPIMTGEPIGTKTSSLTIS